jgi:large subunit ribosomal protein L18
MLEKKEKRKKRHKRIRAKVSGTAQKPRLCVFRSAKHIYAQLIDDEKSKIIASVSDLELKDKKLKKIDKARKIGELIGKKAQDLKIEKVIFDRAGYNYHGRVKAVADGAREQGLKF